MVAFPVPVWRTDFELVRETIKHDKIKANEIQAGPNTTWMDVLHKVTRSFCEFCVLLNIAAVQNSKGYLLTRETRYQNPIVHTVVHNKELYGRNHRTISKGCCLSFNLTTHARCRAHMVGLDKVVCTNNSTMSCIEVLTPGDHYEVFRTDNVWEPISSNTDNFGVPAPGSEIAKKILKHYSQNVPSELQYLTPRERDRRVSLCLRWLEMVDTDSPNILSKRGNGGEQSNGPRERSSIDAFLATKFW